MGVVVKRLCAGSILSRRITFHIQAELLSVAHPYERAEAEIIARRVGHTFTRLQGRGKPTSSSTPTWKKVAASHRDLNVASDTNGQESRQNPDEKEINRH